jgi:MFS family permease
MLYLFAAIFGLAYANIATILSPLTAGLFGLKSHGSVYGIIVFSFQIGAAIGPLIMGYMHDINSSYRVAFLISTGTAILGLIVVVLLKPVKLKIEKAAVNH